MANSQVMSSCLSRFHYPKEKKRFVHLNELVKLYFDFKKMTLYSKSIVAPCNVHFSVCVWIRSGMETIVKHEESMVELTNVHKMNEKKREIRRRHSQILYANGMSSVEFQSNLVYVCVLL